MHAACFAGQLEAVVALPASLAGVSAALGASAGAAAASPLVTFAPSIGTAVSVQRVWGAGAEMPSSCHLLAFSQFSMARSFDRIA
jgi:hypothetical protein